MYSVFCKRFALIRENSSLICESVAFIPEVFQLHFNTLILKNKKINPNGVH